MKILILTGKFGSGHVSAAKAIEEDINDLRDGNDIVVCDLIQNIFPHIYKFIYIIFNWVAKNQPNMYNSFNRISDRPLSLLVKLFLAGKIKLLLQEHTPDLIISTVPLGAKYISDYKARYMDSIPLITYITDISAQNEWISDNTDLYVVGSDFTKKDLEDKGVDVDKIVVNGIPVQKKFKKLCAEKRNTGKKVLIMGGGLGLINSLDKLISAIKKNMPAQITLIAGNNKRLHKKVAKKYPDIKVHKFRDDIHKLMRENDVLVTKAGGITLFESVYSGLPMLITKPFFSQEISNAKFIEERKIGTIMWDGCSDIENEVSMFMSDDKELLNIQDNIKSFQQQLNNYSFNEILDKAGVQAQGSRC